MFGILQKLPKSVWMQENTSTWINPQAELWKNSKEFLILPTVLKCLEHIKNGDLGEIYSINAEMSTYHDVK